MWKCQGRTPKPHGPTGGRRICGGTGGDDSYSAAYSGGDMNGLPRGACVSALRVNGDGSKIAASLELLQPALLPEEPTALARDRRRRARRARGSIPDAADAAARLRVVPYKRTSGWS